MTPITASGSLASNSITPFVFTPRIEGKTSSDTIGTVYIDKNTGKNLLGTLYGPSTSSMTTAQLVSVLVEEIGKTREQVALMQTLLLKGQSARVAAMYKENIQKLLDAAQAQAEVAKQKEELEIVKWTLFAVSLIISICSLGSASGVAAIIGSVNSIVSCLLGVIPYNKKGDSIMDGVTLGFEKAIAAIQLAIIKDLLRDKAKEVDGLDFDTMTDEQIMKFAQKVNDATNIDFNYKDHAQYSAMTMVLIAQITIAVTIIVVGIIAQQGEGAAVGAGEMAKSAITTSATSGVKLAANAAGEVAKKVAETATKSATDVAKKVGEEVSKKATAGAVRAMLQKILDKTEFIRLNASKIQKGVSVVEGLAQVGNGAGQIVVAQNQLEVSFDQADAQAIGAAIKILLRIIEQDEKFLQEILASQTTTAQVVTNILKEEHEKNKKLGNALTFG